MLESTVNPQARKPAPPGAATPNGNGQLPKKTPGHGPLRSAEFSNLFHTGTYQSSHREKFGRGLAVLTSVSELQDFRLIFRSAFLNVTHETSETFAQPSRFPIHPFSISPHPTRSTEFEARPRFTLPPRSKGRVTRVLISDCRAFCTIHPRSPSGASTALSTFFFPLSEHRRTYANIREHFPIRLPIPDVTCRPPPPMSDPRHESGQTPRPGFRMSHLDGSWRFSSPFLAL